MHKQEYGYMDQFLFYRKLLGICFQKDSDGHVYVLKLSQYYSQ